MRQDSLYRYISVRSWVGAPFKITHRIESLDSDMFLKYKTDNRTWGHSWALAKERYKLDIRKYAFSDFFSANDKMNGKDFVNATSVNNVQEY